MCRRPPRHRGTARSRRPRATPPIPPPPPARSSAACRTSPPGRPPARRRPFRGGVGVEVAKEIVPARRERADPDQALGFAGDDLFHLHGDAFELFWARVLIDDIDAHAFAGRNADLGRFEPVVLDRDGELLRARNAWPGRQRKHPYY